jgi:hypothetical protein
VCGSLLFGNGSDNSCTPRLDEKLPNYFFSYTYFSFKEREKEKMLVCGILTLKHGVCWWSDRAEGRGAV